MPSPNLYSDAEESAPEAPEQKAPDQPEKEQAEEKTDNDATAVIPKALLGGKEFKPGEEITLEVVQLTEDGAVVKYASPKEEEPEGEGESAPAEPAAAPGGMASMMQ